MQNLTVALRLLALLLALCFPIHNAIAIELSADDRTYLNRIGPITMCVDPDWAPFERINPQGQHEGIAGDLIRLVAGRLGITIDLLPTGDWEASIQASKEGRCKIMSFLNQTPKREEWLVFTDPIFSDPNVLITREEHLFIADLSKLRGERIALPKESSILESVRRDFPNLVIVPTDSEEECFSLVAERRAELSLRSLIVAAYTIKKQGLFTLKLNARLPQYTNRLRIGVLKGEPQLRDILNRGIATLTEEDTEAIINRHVSIRIESPTDYRLIGPLAAGAAAVLAVVGLWLVRLRRANRELAKLSQTDPLTQMHNRMKIERELQLECDRALRYGRPLTVMVLDIDHFKRVNDIHGHLIGDHVLVTIADTLRASLRTSDLAGRWGGEEFLLICPETDGAQALTVAERIAEAIRGTVFATGERHTVSIGLSSLAPGDTPHALLRRADEALYRAKNNGRDRAEAG